VSVNRDLKVFEVELEGESFKERRMFSRTSELVQFLRLPVSQATGYRSYGDRVIWDHKTDIAYDDDLFFLKPLVHRSRFYVDVYHYPKICKELLEAERGDDIIMVIQPDSASYRVEFEGLPQDSTLRELETVGFDVYAIGLLTECRELYDSKKIRLYPVSLDVDAIMDVRFSDLGDYPRLQEAIENVDIRMFDWGKESWKLWTRIVGNEIRWSVMSTTTERVWMRRVFSFILNPGSPPDMEMARFREIIESVVPHYHLSNLNDRLNFIRQSLIERYQEFHSSLRDESEEEEIDEEDISIFREGLHFRLRGVETRGQIVVVLLESDDGETEEVYVLHDCKSLLKDSEFAGGIEEERVDIEVDSALRLYNLDDDTLNQAKEKVKETLAEKGIRFHTD
jgi:hypothetical protein